MNGEERCASYAVAAETVARSPARCADHAAVPVVAAVAAGRPERESYLPHVGITCLMDMGNGAAYVHRDDTVERMIPLPVVGHWLKKGWGSYFALSKKRIVPRLPGM